jgi:heavy metal translocating P-type ATPase
MAAGKAAARSLVPPADSGLLGGTSALGLAGLVARVVGATALADGLWTAGTCLGMLPAVSAVAGSLRQRELGVDLVAVLALAGALAVGEPLAGAVIALMVVSGRSLESLANRRASRDLSALLDRAPRWANRYRDGRLDRIPADEVARGNLLMVRTGEMVPVDGSLQSVTAVLDESALTGESMPVERTSGDAVRSGVINGGAPFTLLATTTAAESAYAGVIRLVEQARAGSAPFVRMANRYAAVFLPATLLTAGLAWLVTGSAVRAVAVLVIATPCPLILAAPVAIVSGMSQTARRGVVVKGGGALEQLARCRTLLFDKTGTLTSGHPVLSHVLTSAERSADEVLRLAASLDQLSPHVLANSIVRAAHARELELSLPSGVSEAHGAGITGTVDGHQVAIGKARFVTAELPHWARLAKRRAARQDAMMTFIALDGVLVGALLFTDPIRPDAAATVRHLRRAGFRRLVMITGDRTEVAERVGGTLGLDAVLAERSPAEKVAAVRAEAATAPTIMVGDGINDAPALASASVGVALGARGATAASETADVVLTVDRLGRLGDAVQIARRARRIAQQSVLAGMALSFAGMGLAAVGLLPPVAGAVAQEGIDVAVILNALRAVRLGPERRARLVGPDAELARRFAAEHAPLRPYLDEIRAVADTVDGLPPDELSVRVRSLYAFLRDRLYPHELAEEHELYPVLDRTLGGHDPTGTMSRAHMEIGHQIDRLGRILDDIGSDTPDDEDVRELRAVLYELHATLALHFVQEEEGYFTLVDEPTGLASAPPP